MHDLFEVPELKHILGYKDIRSIRAWCRKHNVAVIALGRKRYVHRQAIEDLIASQLPYKNGCRGESDANRNNDVLLFGQAPKRGEKVSKGKRKAQPKIKHSQAAIDLINAVHSGTVC